MTATKYCLSCGDEKDISEFEPSRNVCYPCRQRAHQKRVSSSPEVYLRQLHAKSKAACKKGKRLALDFKITPEDIIDLYHKQQGRCALSGVILTHHKDGSGHKEFNISIDRLNNDLGYTIDNIRLVAYRLNMMRGTMTNDMFYWWIRTINDFTCR